MCKASNEMVSKVEELMEIRKMIEELENEASVIVDEVKQFMGAEETMMAGCYKVTYKEQVSHRIDSAALKKVLGDALEGYYKTVVTRPFKII